MNVFLSQPMRGLSDQQIAIDRSNATIRLTGYLADIPEHWPQEWKDPDNWMVIDNINTEELPHPLMYLSKDIAAMASAQLLFLTRGWEHAHGCRVERAAAEEYGLYIINETSDGRLVYQDPIETIEI